MHTCPFNTFQGTWVSQLLSWTWAFTGAKFLYDWMPFLTPTTEIVVFIKLLLREQRRRPDRSIQNHYTHTPFNGPFSRTTRVSRYQKGKTNLDFTEARDSAWQWHQLGHMQVCTSLQPASHHSVFLQAGCPSCCPTNSVKALKAKKKNHYRQRKSPGRRFLHISLVTL